MKATLSVVFLTTFVASVHPSLAATDLVPRLDIKGSCRDARDVSSDGETRKPGTTAAGNNQPDTYKACMQDEEQAHSELSKKWKSFTSPSRQTCVAAGANPSPSYVELLTCLEMNNDVNVPFRPDSGGVVAPGSPSSRPSGSPGSGRM